MFVETVLEGRVQVLVLHNKESDLHTAGVAVHPPAREGRRDGGGRALAELSLIALCREEYEGRVCMKKTERLYVCACVCMIQK